MSGRGEDNKSISSEKESELDSTASKEDEKISYYDDSDSRRHNTLYACKYLM